MAKSLCYYKKKLVINISRKSVTLHSIIHSKYALPALCFGMVFLYFTYPMGLSDYWWHMNTGRWIWQNQSLPSVDPFTYSYATDDDLRRELILKAYYLGQLLFYLVYSWFGVWGLLFLKAALLTLPLWLLWRFMLYRGVPPAAGLILISLLPPLLYRFDELRAVIFSFIGTIAVFFLIEVILDRLRQQKPLGWLLVALPFTMLLWANLHRGFLIGWVLLLAYGVSETIKLLRKNNALNPAAYQTLVLVFGVSIFISLLNPNGLSAIFGNQAELLGPFTKVIDEFFPLWKYAHFYDSMMLFYGCAIVALFASFYMLRARREVDYVYWLLLAGFIFEGFSVFRFSFFLVIMCLAIAAPYYRQHSQWLVDNAPRVSLALLFLSVTFLTGMVSQRTALLYGPWEKAYFPSDATYYVIRNRPPANIFNAFEYGGYLGWKLYPNYQIFIDQRNLDYDVYQEYGVATSGNYRQVFQKYNINTVLFYHTQPVTQRRPAIVSQLMNDPAWQLVYLDQIASVFVRASNNPGLSVIDKKQADAYLRHNK